MGGWRERESRGGGGVGKERERERERERDRDRDRETERSEQGMNDKQRFMLLWYELQDVSLICRHGKIIGYSQYHVPQEDQEELLTRHSMYTPTNHVPFLSCTLTW